MDDETIRSEHLSLPRSNTGNFPPAGNETPELDDYLDSIEKARILKALEEARWNRTAAARKLGISLRALRYRLDKLGLN
jgi:two-component system response regulator PilR (NtrC family)